jgi:hypothetical protein
VVKGLVVGGDQLAAVRQPVCNCLFQPLENVVVDKVGLCVTQIVSSVGAVTCGGTSANTLSADFIGCSASFLPRGSCQMLQLQRLLHCVGLYAATWLTPGPLHRCVLGFEVVPCTSNRVLAVPADDTEDSYCGTAYGSDWKKWCCTGAKWGAKCIVHPQGGDSAASCFGYAPKSYDYDWCVKCAGFAARSRMRPG